MRSSRSAFAVLLLQIFATIPAFADSPQWTMSTQRLRTELTTGKNTPLGVALCIEGAPGKWKFHQLEAIQICRLIVLAAPLSRIYAPAMTMKDMMLSRRSFMGGWPSQFGVEPDGKVLRISDNNLPLDFNYFLSYESGEADNALRESGAIAWLEEKHASEFLAQYHNDFDTANSIASLEIFIAKYQDDDPESLKVKAEAKIAALQLTAYNRMYDQAQTSQQLTAFIKAYEKEDIGDLVALAKQRLPEVEKREREQNAITRTQTILSNLRARIGNCNDRIELAQRLIAREHQIGETGGYVNAMTLHDASALMIDCENILPPLIDQYQKYGGAGSPQTFTNK